jgi:hypothetical protein
LVIGEYMEEELYIRVENGQAVDHPITGWNLRMIYPNASEDNIPKGFERFTRMPIPSLDRYQILEGVVYEKSNYGWHDRYIIRDMTDEEKLVFDAQVESIEELRSYPREKLEALNTLLEAGEIEPTPEAMLTYLRNL